MKSYLCDNASVFYTADVISTKPMHTGLVTANAETLAYDITESRPAAVYGIYFDIDKASIRPKSKAGLNEIAKLLYIQTIILEVSSQI